MGSAAGELTTLPRPSSWIAGKDPRLGGNGRKGNRAGEAAGKRENEKGKGKKGAGEGSAGEGRQQAAKILSDSTPL